MFLSLSIWTIATLLVGSAVLLAVLHRLRIRPQTVWVNTTLFWNHALRRTRARSFWHRFRHPLTYLLLLLIASLLVFALGDPQPVIDTTDREHTVFVLDLGSSMAAPVADDQTRLDRAKVKLVALADEAVWPEGIAVVAAGTEPRLIHAMGDLLPMLEYRLESLKNAAIPTDRAHAVQLARSLLEGLDHASVCLITDRPFDEGHAIYNEETLPLCNVIQVGSPVSNAAILSAVFWPDEKNPLVGTLHVRAGVWPDEKMTVKLTARREGGPVLAEKEVTATSSEKHTETTVELEVEQLAADGGTVLIEVTGDDCLATDNLVRYRLPVRRPIRVRVEQDLPRWLAILMELDSTLIRSDSNDVDVRLQVVASEPLPEPGRVAQTFTGEAETIAFEDLYYDAGIPRTRLDNSITPLITAGKSLLVASQPTAPCPTLWVADVAWKDDAPVIRLAAWPYVVRHAIRELAGWKASPMSLDPITAGQISELDRETPARMPGCHAASDLTAVEETEASATASSFFTPPRSAWTEWLLLAALALAAIEIILHTKGKIA